MFIFGNLCHILNTACISDWFKICTWCFEGSFWLGESMEKLSTVFFLSVLLNAAINMLLGFCVFSSSVQSLKGSSDKSFFISVGLEP